MVIIGLLVILLAAGAATWFYLAMSDLPGGGPANDLTALGVTVGLSPVALLLTGFGLAVLLGLGLSLIRGGISASSRRRRERKELERTAEENRKAAEAAAQERLRTERARATDSPAPTTQDNGRLGITEPVRHSDTGWRTRTEGDVPPPPARH